MPPNSDVVKGRAAIQAMWQGVFGSGVTGVDLTTLEVEAHGNSAHEVGTYVIKVKDAVADRGKYVVVWKKVGGQWQLHRDIWNTSQPAPKP
jgi:ketosteroid isomerase-like protein